MLSPADFDMLFGETAAVAREQTRSRPARAPLAPSRAPQTSGRRPPSKPARRRQG